MREHRSSLLSDLSTEQRTQLGRNAAFVLLGLIAGLFVAWVIWPVEIQNSTLDGLSPALRAEYLSALADAYVATGGENAQTTLARLDDLSAPEAELAAAIQYYQDNASSSARLREINLRSLASAYLAQTDAVVSLPSSDSPSTPSWSLSEFNVLLAFLAAVLLIGGGIWIFYQFVLRRDHALGVDSAGSHRDDDDSSLGGWIDDGDSQFDDEDAGEDAGEDTGQDVDEEGIDEESDPNRNLPKGPRELSRSEQMDFWRSRQPKPVKPTSVPQTRKFGADPAPSAVERQSMPADRSDSIHIETDIDVTPPRREDTATSTQGSRREAAPAPSDDRMWERDADEISEDQDEAPDSEHDDDSIVETEDAASSLPLSEAETEPPARAESPPAAPAKPVSEPPPLPGPATYDSLKRPPKPAQQETGNKRNDFGALSDRLPFRRKESPAPRQEVLAEVTARYYHGITDYDESFTISTPGTPADILGACGMGTKNELDPTPTSSDEVRVLDIWLYDKAILRTQNQIVVGRGVDIDRLAGTSSGTVTGEALRAVPGQTFRLFGEQLILDCKIDSVSYLNEDKNAPLASVVVSMVVRRKA